MAKFSLGANNPKREISLNPVVSIILIMVWLVLMASIIYFLYSTFIAEEPSYYIICSNGSRIEYNESRTEYCGMLFDSFDDVEDYIDEKIENYDPYEQLNNYGSFNETNMISIIEEEDE